MASNRSTSGQHAQRENHRRFARHRVETLAYVDLGSNNGGTVIDISESGISFQGVRPLEKGQVVPIGFKLPGIDQSVKTTGQIAWLNDSRKGGGLRFVELPKATMNLLKGWLSGTAADTLSPRIETETAHSSQVLRGLVQRNRPSVDMKKNLVDLLRDSSLSRGAVVAAVNASRSTVIAARSSVSADLKERPIALPPCAETETTDSFQVLRALVQQNHPSIEKNKNLVDLLRDSSLSRGAAVSAVNASRSTMTAARSTESERTPRFPRRAWVTKSSPARLTLGAWRKLLPLALVTLLSVALFQHYRGQTLHASSTASGDSPFELKVERVGKDWQVRWNRNSDVVAKAVSGTFLIADGPFRKELHMDPSELRSGSMMYTPATDDVVVRLQVVGENLAQPVSESVRIVAGKMP